MRSRALFGLALGVGCSAAPVPAATPVVTIVPVEATPSAAESAAPAPAEIAPRAAPKPVASAVPAGESNLEQATLGSAGVAAGGVSGGLLLGPGSRSIQPGHGTGGLAALGATAPASPSPMGRVAVGHVDRKGGDVVNAEPVAAGMQAGFRRCYNKALQSTPL